MGQNRRPHTSVARKSEQHTSSAYGQPLRQRCCPTTLNCPGGLSLSITTSRQIASGKHFKGQMARPRSSHVPMHCRYSKAPTHARFARRLNGEEDACGHEDRLPSVRWRHRRAGERATAVRHARLRCRLPHVVPRAASRASAEARLVLPRLRPSRARHAAATAVDGFTAQAAARSWRFSCILLRQPARCTSASKTQRCSHQVCCWCVLR